MKSVFIVAHHCAANSWLTVPFLNILIKNMTSSKKHKEDN